jgi:hypothetical protein
VATARIDVDHPAVARWATRGLAVLALTAFAVGAPSLVEVGNWAGLGWAAWGLPLVVDLGLVIGAVSATVARQRQTRAGLLWFGTIVLVMLSTVAQGVHAWTRADVDGPARWVAIALGALPPLAVLWSTEALIRLIVSEPVGHRSRRDNVARATRTEPRRRTELAHEPDGTPQLGQGQGSGQGSLAEVRAAKPADGSSPMGQAEVVARARELLAVDPSVRAAAAALGVSRSSLQRWLKADDDQVGQDVEEAAA